MSSNSSFYCNLYGPEFLVSETTYSFLSYVYTHSPHTWEAANKTECFRSENMTSETYPFFLNDCLSSNCWK